MEDNPLQARLKSLGLNVNQLAVRMAEDDPEGRSARTLYTAARKVVNNPEGARLETLKRVVAALGGDIKIEWQPVEAEEVTL